MKMLLLAGVVALVPLAAVAGGDLPMFGVVDWARIQVGRPIGGANDQRAYVGANASGSGVIAGAVSGNIPSGIQAKAFSVVGPAGPYTEGPGFVRTSSRPRW